MLPHGAKTSIALCLLATAAATVALAAPPPTRAVPTSMRAAALDAGGGPEVLTLHELPVPMPGAGEVLVAVHAAGVGVWEADMRRNLGNRARSPLVLGSDGSGVVAALGPGVRAFKLGDEVYGTGFGFYAEYVKVWADRLAHLPKGMGLTEAGALAISGLSALQGIDDVLQMKRGETLLIHGAAGAVGSLAIPLAKLKGVRVLATVTDDAGRAFASKLGADAVVNGRTGDIAAAAKQFAPDGVDAVLGLAGGKALEDCIDTLRRDGQGRVAYLYGIEPVPRPRGSMRMSLYSFVGGSRELARLNKAVEASKLRVPVAAEFPLAEAAQAHRRLEGGHLLGKVVLRAD
jgi:NADPH:quinone reductase-like Zn-dependent oxidoreductase